MLYAKVEKQSWIAPVLLGFSALIVCAVSAALKFPLGGVAAETLLFLAPLAFGIRGVLLVLSVCVLPLAINSGDVATGTRLAILLMSIAITQHVLPIVPGYVTTLLVWLACVSPTLALLQASGAATQGALREPRILSLLQDVLVAALAGCLIFNEGLWWRLTGRVRYLNANQILPHLMAATSLTALFVVALSLREAGLLDLAVQTQVGMTLGTLIVAVFVLIPTLFGIHIMSSLAISHGAAFLSTGHSSTEVPIRNGSSMNALQDDAWEIVDGKQSGAGTAHEERTALELGVCALDGNGVVLFMNDNFQRLVGLPEKAAIGTFFEPLCASASLAQYIWQLVSTTDSALEHNEDLRVSGRKDGVKFIRIQLCSHQLAEPPAGAETSERPPRVVKISDITAKKTIDERLSRIQRHKALSACARSAAPQLSELFTAILGRASHAQQSEQSQLGALRQIQALCAQGGALVQQLSELSIPPENAERQTIDIASAITERMPLLKGLVPPGIDVQCSDASAALLVKLDHALLTQALALLLMNAAEAYQDGKGKVSLSVQEEDIDEVVSKLHPGSRPGRFARISISDYGRGMPPELLARVANPLLTIRGEYGHIGLDLPSVLAVMSEHDGFMTVESRPERGTTVSLYFPLCAQPTASARHRQVGLSLQNGESHASKKVMIVEGGPELRELLSEMVKSLGYVPITCEGRDGAMQLLESEKVDILLVDESLPGLAVHDLVSRAHATASHVKTVLLSSAHNSPSEDSDAVLLKPFDISQLAQALDDSEQSEQMQ